MLLKVSRLGRYETRKGTQSPPNATGLPSRDTSTSDSASARDDISSTLEYKNEIFRKTVSRLEVNGKSILMGVVTFVNRYFQDTVFVIWACFEIQAASSNGFVLNSILLEIQDPEGPFVRHI